ncbi:ganglioside-induced differentiation-associated protein 1-like 1 [Platysternon megacephalum]|uniref:DNA-dependent metalloprotease SPRTN n=1 Tax=Platysternon megacephalum TaxID=55544 RepID=A0A4D9EN70_9SAUR|nr:ganglioside-induced differentiation-associated protein 1-like 1 [Platysternon megacephalum]
MRQNPSQRLPVGRLKGLHSAAAEPARQGCSGSCSPMDGDFLLALRLQAQWEEEEEAAAVAAACSESPPGSSAPTRPLSVVDEAWELLDPSPDVRGLFVQFNETLFWGKLAAVAVTWSPRMTLCAGVCSYEGRGGMCSIRLSEPLLKLRPRKDLVETLLHEMIHALLFVTNNDKDHESHGPEFCKHMRRINRLTGANVTIYHDFHDEVDSYRQHWWRCNGPCQSRKPYYGYVKRAMNRAPSGRDFWWSDHQQTCGGTFSKVKEPENYSKKGKEKTQLAKLSNSEPSDSKGRIHGGDIRSLIPFSGKGYQLGGAGLWSSERHKSSNNSIKGREIPSPQCYSAAGTARSVPKNELKFEPNIFSTSISHPVFTDSSKHKNSFALNHKFPKISVANTKAYRNVDGSPVKIPPVNGGNLNQSPTNATSVFPSFNETPKRTSFGQAETTLRSWVSSQGNSSFESGGIPQKQPKMEDKSAFVNYFIKRESTDATFRTSTPLKNNAEPTVSSESCSSAVSQDKKVSCPVCQTEVLETKINEHLDSCLT